MKKIYTTSKTPAVSNFKNFYSPYRFPFIKTLSLVSVAVLLSSASPVSACDTWGNISTYFGAGTNVLRNIAPTYIISGNVYRDVGSAFVAVNNEFKDIYRQFSLISSDKIVQQNSLGTITIGANKGGSVVDFTNNSHAARVIVGVRDAVLSPTSDQAVNGSQLYKLGTGLAKSFGGGAGYDTGGNWLAPTFTVKVIENNGKKAERNYKNVADAFTGVGDSFVNLNKKVENLFLNALGENLVQQNSVGTITVGANKNGYVVDFANNSREARVIVGVRDGALNLISEQAVNGSQLYKLGLVTMKSFGGGADYKDGNWHAPTFTVKVFDKNGNETDGTYHNVADAFTGVNSSFTNINKRIEDIVINVSGENLVKQDTTSGLITIGGKVSGTKVSIANIDNAVRTLSGVNAGSITATSTDAINGSQLFEMNNKVATYFGGGADYKDGNWHAPTFTVKVFDKNGNETDGTYHNVADAFTGVNSSFTNINKRIEDIVINVSGENLVKQDTTSGLITIGGKVSGTKVSIANVDNVARTLSGVKAGSISATSMDAINGSQLYSMSNVVADYFGGGASYKNGTWSAPTFTFKILDQSGNATERTYHNVADALSSVGSSFTNLNQKIENIAGSGLIQVDSLGDVHIGSNIGGGSLNVRDVGNALRVISGIKGGAVKKNSSEAVNGSQLYFLADNFAKYFGDGAGYGENNEWLGPVFTVISFDEHGNETKKNYNDVAAAFDGVNSAFTSLNREILKIKKVTNADEIYNATQNNNTTSDNFPFGEDFPFARSLPVKRLSQPVGEGNSPAEIERNDTAGALASMNNKVEQKETPDDVSESQISHINDKIEQVGGRVNDLETKVNGIDTKVEDIATEMKGVVKYDKDDHNKISLVGADGSEPVVIDNVGDGRIEAGSKKAVNGNEVYNFTKKQVKSVLDEAQSYTNDKVGSAINEAKFYTDMKFEALSYDIKNVRKEARQAAAIGLAVSNLRYFDEPGSLSVSFGGGLWRGQSALAIGAGYTSEDGKIRSNLSVTSAGGQWGVGGGITLRLK